MILTGVMPARPNMRKHLTKLELEERYRKEASSRVKERLLAILLLYDGKKVYEVSSIVRRSVRTIEDWIGRWNKRGCDGLVPRLTGGPRPKLSDGEWDRIIEEIENKGMTIRDVKVYVKSTRGVEYAYKTARKILRKEKSEVRQALHRNRKRPENAEEILKKGSTMLSLR